LLVIGVGELDDDIEVQAAKTEIAASEAAMSGPAVRVGETAAMVGYRCEREPSSRTPTAAAQRRREEQ
jgi:hypothetical protein